jgi:hypothetical protein
VVATAIVAVAAPALSVVKRFAMRELKIPRSMNESDEKKNPQVADN